MAKFLELAKTYSVTFSSLDEAITNHLLPSMSWDGMEWVVYFAIDDVHAYCGVDKDLNRAVKKAYYAWKDIYFNEDVD